MMRYRRTDEAAHDSLRADFDALTRDATPRSGHPSEDMWVRFASGELPPDEREAVADHVLACAQCANVYRAVMHLRREASAFDEGAPQPSPTARGWSWRQTGLALAASLIIAVGAALVLREARTPDQVASTQTETETAAPSAPAPPAPLEPRAWALGATAPEVKLPAWLLALTVRSAETKADDRLRAFGEAIAPYRQGLYAEAAQSLAPLASQHPEVPEFAFYLGVSRLLANDAAAALAPLRAARDSSVLADEARWYEAVALERTGRPQDAEQALRSLCDSSGPYRDRACAIVRPSP